MKKETKKRIAKEILIFIGLAIVSCLIWMVLEMKQSYYKNEIKEINVKIQLLTSERDSLTLPSYDFLELINEPKVIDLSVLDDKSLKTKPKFDPNKPYTEVKDAGINDWKEVPKWEDSKPINQKELDSLNHIIIKKEKERIASFDGVITQLLQLNRTRNEIVKKATTTNKYIENLAMTCSIMIGAIYLLRFLIVLILWSIRTLKE